MKKALLNARRLRGDLSLGLDSVRVVNATKRLARSYLNGTQLVAEQDFLAVSATQNYTLGTRMVADGGVYYYAQAGAVLLPIGTLHQSPIPVAAQTGLVFGANYAAGVSVVAITVGAGGVTLNEYAEGHIWVDTGTGAGQRLRVISNTAAAGAASATFTCYDALTVTLAADSRASLIRNPYAALIIHPSPPTAMVAGVTPRAVPISNFFWLQTWGDAPVLTQGVVYISRRVIPSRTVDGAIEHSARYVTTGPTAIAVMENGAIVIDSAGAESGPRFAKTAINTTYDLGPMEREVGWVRRVLADTKYSMIFLTIAP